MSFIQSVSAQAIAANVTTAPIDTTSGDLLYVMICRAASVVWSGTPLTDNYGNAWQLAWLDGNSHGVGGSGAAYYAENCIGGTGHTFTLTLPSGSEGIALAVGEWSNIPTSGAFLGSAHTSNAGPGTAIPPILSGALAGIVTGQLLIGSATVTHGSEPAASTGRFTDLYRADADAHGGVILAYALVNAIGQYRYAYNLGSNSGSGESYGLATFKGTNIAYVQQTGVFSVIAPSSITTPAITTTSGNFLVVIATTRWPLHLVLTSGSVTDSYGNVWQVAWIKNTGPDGYCACLYVEDCTGGAGHTFTLSISGDATLTALSVAEFSGIDLSGSLDQTIASSGFTRPYDTGLAALTTQAEELLIGGGSTSVDALYGYSTVALDWTTDQVLDCAASSGAEGVILAHQYAAADGSYEYGMNSGAHGSTSWEAVGISAFSALLSIACHNPEGRVSVAYVGSLSVTGGTPPYVFSLAAGALPLGLTLNASTGAITGTPTQSGTFPITGQVTDDNGDTALVACFIIILDAFGTALDVTWVFDAVENQWHQRMSYDEDTDTFIRWKVRGCASVGSRIFAGDYATGDLYALDMDTFTDDGDRIKRERAAPYLSGENQILALDQVEVGIQAGVGNADDFDPQISFSLSKDSGVTFNTPIDTSMGVAGKPNARARWRRRGQGRADRLVAKVTSTAKVRHVWGPGLWIRSTSGTGEM